MRIVVAADPFGLELKEAVKKHLVELGHDVTDIGGHENQNVNYYDVAVVAAQTIQKGAADRAVLFCGTGMGMAIVTHTSAPATGPPFSSTTFPSSA